MVKLIVQLRAFASGCGLPSFIPDMLPCESTDLFLSKGSTEAHHDYWRCLLILLNEGHVSHCILCMYAASPLFTPVQMQSCHFRTVCVYSLETEQFTSQHFLGPSVFAFVHVTLWWTRRWVASSIASHPPRPFHMGFHSPINIKVGQGLFLGKAARQIVLVFMIHTSPY